MKKRFLILGLALATSVSFAQKKEIKKAERAIKSGKYTEALSNLNDAESTITNVDTGMQAQFYALRGEALAGSAGGNFNKLKDAAEAFERAIALDANISKSYSDVLHNLRSALINAAVSDQNNEQYAKAAEKLTLSYKVSQDPSDLFFAAGNQVNAKNYDEALTLYQKILDLGYTGETKEYVATHKETGEVVPFESENMRNIHVKSGEYIKPQVRTTASRKGEILKNMTLIYIQEGKTDEAKELMASARKENPNDVNLMRAEADMSYNMGDMRRYNELMNQIVATDPDNPEIHFNLGVASAELGEAEKAEKYYKKALELRPDYKGALINLAVLKLSKERDLVEQMNSLGTTRADNLRYDELKKQLEGIYREAIPYLENARNIDQKNVEITRTLMNIYGQLGEEAKQKELKARLDALEKN